MSMFNVIVRWSSGNAYKCDQILATACRKTLVTRLLPSMLRLIELEIVTRIPVTAAAATVVVVLVARLKFVLSV